jgi:HK97 gp10 family phage protein
MPTFGRTQQAARGGAARDARGRYRSNAFVVEGVDAIVNRFTLRSKTIGPLAGAAAVRGARRAADVMRSTVAVDRGDVRDSITSDTEPTIEGTTIYADAGPTHFVGKFLEEGTVRMAPQPFAQPAADQVVPEFVNDIRRLA